MRIEIINGDCFDLIKSLPDNSIDLVLTSPPYVDIVNYGKEVSIKKPDDYCDWILPLFKEIHRVLKPSGSFILNINDKCEGGYRSTFIYDLISRNNKETDLKLYDTYFWHKLAGIPNGATKRFRNMTEFIFHFCKDKSKMKFHMKRVMIEQKDSTKNRFKYKIQNPHGTIENGIRNRDEGTIKNITEYARPDNIFRFKTAGSSRDNTIKHPAPFHKELPLYFINLLTDDNDVVLDPFNGIGTTGVASKELNRNYIGFELNLSYKEFSENRINGNELEVYVINKYSLDDKFIQSYKSAGEALKYNPNCCGKDDIVRCYNRIGFNTCGGFIWKKEPIQ